MLGAPNEKKAGVSPGFFLGLITAQAAWMLEACLPLGPCVTSNWTF